MLYFLFDWSYGENLQCSHSRCFHLGFRFGKTFKYSKKVSISKILRPSSSTQSSLFSLLRTNYTTKHSETKYFEYFALVHSEAPKVTDFLATVLWLLQSINHCLKSFSQYKPYKCLSIFDRASFCSLRIRCTRDIKLKLALQMRTVLCLDSRRLWNLLEDYLLEHWIVVHQWLV